MPPRATEQEVKQIISTTLTVDEITPFLTVANVVVDANLTGQNYGDATMREIERWLAAHFVAIRDPRVSREKLGDADATYHGQSGMGLDATPYGQQVKVLDYNGVLAQLGSSGTGATMEAIL